MLRRHVFSLALACLAIPGAALAQSSEAAVRSAFDAYVEALEARDGDRAAGRVTADTLAFYDECRRAALTMPRDELEGRDFIFRYTTLSLRHELDAARLSPMSGHDVFARAVDEGQVGANISQMEVTGVQVRGDRARLRLATPSGGQAPLELRREGGRWRVDIGQLIRATSPALARAAGQMGGGDENAGLTRLLGAASGSAVSPSVWRPLR
ncbi:MAG TPA: hypothetical protein RMH99_17155 [Sandaracinaceae bacterium LLY-WYZ-13_1]|nr:hypothetical protein [Sandaracinaceae bacterium LLY-WYZ-13_1]